MVSLSTVSERSFSTSYVAILPLSSYFPSLCEDIEGMIPTGVSLKMWPKILVSLPTR